MNEQGQPKTFEDLLCDKCLNLMEANRENGVPLADFCKNCQRRVLGLTVQIPAEEVEGHDL
jgi:hypothetical protein